MNADLPAPKRPRNQVLGDTDEICNDVPTPLSHLRAECDCTALITASGTNFNQELTNGGTAWAITYRGNCGVTFH